MKTFHTEFKLFTITQYEKEEKYLREMHSKGWKLVSVRFPGLYKFEACEPEDVIYCLDYNRDGDEHKGEYVRMFEDCGWGYMFDFMGYSYFRKSAAEADGDESIFCDDESRLDMMKRVLKSRLLPLFVIFSGVILPQLFLQRRLHGSISNWLYYIYLLLAAVYLMMFFFAARDYRKFKEKLGK